MKREGFGRTRQWEQWQYQEVDSSGDLRSDGSPCKGKGDVVASQLLTPKNSSPRVQTEGQPLRMSDQSPSTAISSIDVLLPWMSHESLLFSLSIGVPTFNGPGEERARVD